MARGGRRSGAGRKSGSKNKLTIERELRARESVAAAIETGETPLDYMLRVMRDDSAPSARRDAMAVAAAPFVHPKLAAVEHSGNEDRPTTFTIITGVPRAVEELERKADAANEPEMRH